MTQYHHLGFLICRTPRLSIAEIVALGTVSEQIVSGFSQSSATGAGRVAMLLRRPDVLEALAVSSPSTVSALEALDPSSRLPKRLLRTGMRYLLRMCGRPVPFGLMATYSVGEVGHEWQVVIDGERTRRHTRLDAGLLHAVAASAELNQHIRRELTYVPNSSLFRQQDHWRYLRRMQVAERWSLTPASAKCTVGFDAVIESARGGVPYGRLALNVSNALTGLSSAAAENLLDEAIERQLLVSGLHLLTVGDDPAEDLLRLLAPIPAAQRHCLALREALQQPTMQSRTATAHTPEEYRRVAKSLEGCTAALTAGPVQIDLERQTPFVAPETLVADAWHGVEVLSAFAPSDGRLHWTAAALRHFASSFRARFAGTRVRLVDALDDDSGIGFDGSADISPDPIEARSRAASNGDPYGFDARDRYLFARLEESWRDRADSIDVTLEDAASFRTATVDLPASVAVTCSPNNRTRGPRLFLRNVAGPSSLRALGRFCQWDRRLQVYAAELSKADLDESPDAILAEVVHLPEPRANNFLSRPAFYPHEIWYAGKGVASASHRIAVDDLWVEVADRRIVLYSKRLGREVRPRVSTAYNYAEAPPVVKFLCALQAQGKSEVLFWYWGRIEEAARFLPRVVSGAVVLSRARWMLDVATIRRWSCMTTVEAFTSVQEWRRRERVPQWVVLNEGGQELPFDLNNALCVDVLIDSIRAKRRAMILELWPPPQDLRVQGPSGPFVSELVIPMARAERSPVTGERPRDERVSPGMVKNRFVPGSEWLYLKMYGGPDTVDTALRNRLSGVLQECRRLALVDQSFFVRYADPDWHLRLRCHGSPQALIRDVLPRFLGAIENCAAGIWRTQLDTYDREVARYGVDGVSIAEQLFDTDSTMAIAYLSRQVAAPGDVELAARRDFCLLAFDAVLTDAGLGLAEKSRAVDAMLDERLGSFRHAFNGAASARYRLHRDRIEIQLAGHSASQAQDQALLALRADRSRALFAEFIALAGNNRSPQSLTSLLSACVHLHANRLFARGANVEELQALDMLGRTYRSRLRRQDRKPS